MARRRRLAWLALAAPLLGAAGCDSCRKSTPPPPLPTPSATASEQPLQLAPEDAATDAAVDAAAEASPKHGGAVAPKANLAACCSALLQNSKSAPPPMNAYMAQAAAACSAAVAAGQDKASVLARIQAALHGAGMPAPCR